MDDSNDYFRGFLHSVKKANQNVDSEIKKQAIGTILKLLED